MNFSFSAVSLRIKSFQADILFVTDERRRSLHSIYVLFPPGATKLESIDIPMGESGVVFTPHCAQAAFQASLAANIGQLN